MAAHLLLLEDDPFCLALLETALLSEGHCVTICQTPDEVLTFARRFPHALALVDFWGRSQLTLSDNDRADLVRVTSAVPAILVTARSWAERCKPEDIGVLAILTKPFEIATLYELVARCAATIREHQASAALVDISHLCGQGCCPLREQ